MAWIILNFNQKRGYYQLRVDELSKENDDKQKSFEILRVKEVIANGDVLKKTGEKLYDIIFENGWKYDRPTTKPENWLGTTKEFIVTTSVSKDGQIKRTFKNVDSEKDWGAIKQKTEQDLEKYIKNDYKDKSVGTYIYEKLLQNPNQKIRGKLIKTIERKYYKQELIAILNKQIEYHSELKDEKLYHSCINELYPHNENHKNNIKNNGFINLIVEDIIFYQRPLKSKKGEIGGCQYETRSYWKEIVDEKTGETKKEFVKNKPVKAIPKSHPLFQEFRLWQWLQNLKIYEREKTIGDKLYLDYDVTNELLSTENDWVELFDYLKTKKEADLYTFLKFFIDKKIIPKQKKDKTGETYTHRWNYPEDKTYPMGETYFSFANRLKKVVGFDVDKNLTPEIIEHLWHIIYSVKDAKEFEQALETFAHKHHIDKTSFVDAFVKFPPFKNDYAAYSYKALNKLLPLMRIGKYWNKENIDAETLDRIDKLLTGEFDEKIRERVREKTIHLEHIEDFKGLPLWLVGYVVYDRHSESNDTDVWQTSKDIDTYLKTFKQHSLRNPIVEQIVLETLRTVRDIWDYYGQGKKGFFDEIHVELGRDIKNPADKRKKMSVKNAENERTNIRIRKLLEELIDVNAKPYSPSHQEILKIYEADVVNSENIPDEIEKIRKNNAPSKADIQKYKLWLEQKYISPYTGAVIPLSKLFTSEYQIEHIIPQSRYFDNSMGNKVICESAVNLLKGNQTANEFIKDKGGSIVDLGNGKKVKVFKWEAYENHCNTYFKKNRTKLKNLLTDEIPEGFINRQLNDSRYISKFIKGLLSKIVREENEQEATAKNLIAVNGAITSKLKQDWGLNDKWNQLILPRFERLNKLTGTQDFTTLNTNGIVIPTVPVELQSKFNKKRIDHRHHALDALVIACCTRKHIQYINSLNNYKVKSNLQPSLMVKNDDGRYANTFALPWQTFPVDALKTLETTLISFKQNLRVINKANNKYWKYVKQKDGTFKKQLVKQTKGDSWTIRKPLHKETVSGKVNIEVGKGKTATAVRTALSEIKGEKQIKQITDSGIREIIIPNHLKNYRDENGKVNFEQAFSPEGIDALNQNIVSLNNGKPHCPIKKVRLMVVGSKFPVSDNKKSPKHKKYVEAAKGTNLFFAIYWDEKKKKRVFETIPLNEVIAHQKQVAHLPKNERTPIPVNVKMGRLLFSLSPNDLVYVPTDEEILQPNLIDFNQLTKEQVDRIYKVNDFSTVIYFTPNCLAKNIIEHEVDYKFNNKKKKVTGYNTKTALFNKIQIKEVCWKLKTDRLGNIQTVIK